MATGTNSAMCAGVRGTRRITAKRIIGSTCMMATDASPRILPNTIE